MTAKANTCEGSDGTTITTANTAPDQWQAIVQGTTGGTTLNFSTAHVAHQGSSFMRYHMPATTVEAYAEWNGMTGAANAYLRFYVWCSAAPTANVRLNTFIGGGTRGSLVFTSTGFLRTVNQAGGTIATMTAAVPFNQWVRVEHEITSNNATTATHAARMYSGGNLELTTPDTNGSLSTAAVSTTALVTAARVGIVSATLTSIFDLDLDTVNYSDVAQPGAAAPPTPNVIMAQMGGR